jgi:hypothetical protein
MGLQLEVLRVPRRVTAKSFADWRRVAQAAPASSRGTDAIDQKALSLVAEVPAKVSD